MYITSVSCNRRFNITGWCVQRRQMRACALHLFWNCAICEIHSSTKSLLITSVEGCGAGLWVGTWVIRPSVWELEFRIWSLDWANWLFLYILKTNKNFLNQSHSRDRVVWTKRGTGGEPPPPAMAIFWVQCYFWHCVLRCEFELFSQAWGASVTKVTGRLYSKHFSVCSRTSRCSLEHEHFNQLHIQGSGTWC